METICVFEQDDLKQTVVVSSLNSLDTDETEIM